ncbi:MerR family transcriptional regulator [Roseovarius spongiae]|uniref:MerR family transcriptional regulator n=1 Tax=Roseovarius spongiae TaxID=2320272 RepID=A0A3A8AZL4_9RHOB|nr:MerR family transcriptional regulator [Roseovarius spongiae]RKF17069.1 MerR family transcriptional regulator [Roseovarius spongiae]
MAKSADAFRTISEVAEWLGIPAHVLRFWESKFTQVKPVKRAGGRRYYRPADMLLLGGIRKLLHEDGMTIKGVQKILREQGVKEVSALSQPLDLDAEDHAPISGIALDVTGQPDEPRGQVLNFDRDKTEPRAPAEDAPEEAARDDTPEERPADPAGDAKEDETAPREETAAAQETETVAETAAPEEEADRPEKAKPKILRPTGSAAMPGFLQKSLDERNDEPKPEEPAKPDADAAAARAESDAAGDDRDEDAASASPEPEPTQAARPEPPRAAPITTPPDPADDEVAGKPSALSALAAMRTPDPEQAALLADLAARLRTLTDTSRPHRGA